MLKEKEVKYRCYGEDVSFNEGACSADNCKYITACKIMCGEGEIGHQWKIIDRLHETHTAGEVMELLQINFKISYNASKMSLKRWRIKNA